MVDDELGFKKQNFFQRIGWAFYMWKLNRDMKIMEKEHYRCRKKDCRRGCHKVISQTVGHKSGNKPWVHVRYIKCIHCNYLFFARKVDKENYLKYQGKDKESFSAFLKSVSNLKAKHSNKVGGDKREDVSSSGSDTPSRLSFKTLAEFGTYLKGWDSVSEMNYWARKINFQKLNNNYELEEENGR